MHTRAHTLKKSPGDFMSENSNQINKNVDRRLAVVAYLRSSAEKNKQRLIDVNHILNGEEPLPGTYPQKAQYDPDVSGDDTGRSGWKSFRNRCILCFFLTILFYVMTWNNQEHLTPYLYEIKSAVCEDYSDNLFDFLEQIPYTLDYEKINVKR